MPDVRPPYGFHFRADGQTLEEDEAEQAVIAVVRQYHAAGLSRQQILDHLQEVGFYGGVVKDNRHG
jgi:hypothetical protein